MHRALLMTLPEFGDAGQRALAMIRRALERFGFEEFVLLPAGARLTRESVHAALDELAERAGPDDACVVYYFGHGHRVVFEDLEGPHAARPFSYLRCDREHEFDALLDIPLRTRLHRLTRACNNLTVILDACHSGRLVRSVPKRRPPPAWLHDELARHDPRDAPPIVCLAGAPPLSEAVRVHEDDVGHLTAELCAALHEVAERRVKVSWHALAHRVRGRVITSEGSEYQWVVASGPVERGLFTSEPVADIGAVGYVVTPAQTWLRAGRLQGCKPGDRWALHDLDERELARGELSELDLHRSVLALDRPRPPELPLEGHARLLRAANPTRIALDPTLLEHCGARLERSAWLRVDPQHAEAELARAGDRMLLRERDGTWPNLELPLDACDAALELLEDRARSRRLLALPSGDADLLRIAGAPEHLRPNQPLALQLACAPDNPDTLYVALVLIDPLGRAWQLEPDQAEGIQVARNQPYPLVTEPATAWPAGVDTDSLPCTLVAIAVDRPVQLGALVRPHPGRNEGLALGLAVAGRRMRGSGREPRPPLEARRWAVVRVAFELRRG